MAVASTDLLGPAAGIATSVCWTATSIFFTAASRRLGPTAVNGLRLVLAVALLGLTLRFLEGQWWPLMTHRQLCYLGLSGVVGLTVCDQCIFTAFVHLGPRRVMLIMTLSPLFALLFGALSLGEQVGGLALVGVTLTLGGVLWVLLERREPRRGDGNRPRDPSLARAARRLLFQGVALSLAAASLQAAGALFAKRGLGHGELPEVQHLSPLAATLVRMVFGMVGVAPLLLIQRLRRRGPLINPEPGARQTGLLFATLGAVFGPFLGVWLSVIAFDRASLGVAQTLCSLSPVMILPLVGRLYGERVGARGLLGALAAVAGAALLFVA